MAKHWLSLDDSQDPGEQVSPELRAEIETIAPSAVVAGSISTAKLKDLAVTAAKVADGAITSPKIATDGVEAANIKANAVTQAKLADNAVGPVQCGTGVVTAVDSSNNPIEFQIKRVTAAEYAGLTPDPNVEYHISA